MLSVSKYIRDQWGLLTQVCIPDPWDHCTNDFPPQIPNLMDVSIHFLAIDQLKILHMSRQHSYRDMYKLFLWSHFRLEQSNNFIEFEFDVKNDEWHGPSGIALPSCVGRWLASVISGWKRGSGMCHSIYNETTWYKNVKRNMICGTFSTKMSTRMWFAGKNELFVNLIVLCVWTLHAMNYFEEM